MCCGCITTSASGLRERTEGEREAEHLPIYLTKIYVSIQGDGRTGGREMGGRGVEDSPRRRQAGRQVMIRPAAAGLQEEG